MLDRTTIDPPLAGAALANVANSPWTGERETLLKSLWLAEELTALQIAGEIGGFENCADGGKNAVIGKARRLHLKPHRKSPSVRGTRKPRVRTTSRLTAAHLHNRKAEAKQKPSVEASPELFIPAGQRCTLQELTDDTCRWPIGDPGKPDFAFCGGMAVSGLPYCGGHCRIAYQPPAARRDRRPVPA